MAELKWEDKPHGAQSVMVAAFEGWNDAGDAATQAVDHLWDAWGARRFASIDPEEFYDFTSTRPHVEIDDGRTRRVRWPVNEFGWAQPSGDTGVVLLRGVEPQLRWRTFCSQILTVAEAVGCRFVLTLGALLADVAHTRPTPVFGNAYDQHVIDALDLEPSYYEGPTGIVGVLHAECNEAGIDSASLWAAVPSYVPSSPSPKATLALVERATGLLSTPVSTSTLEIGSVGYEAQITELVSEDDATLEYVHHLEDQYDHDDAAVASADDLVDEVERFLREQ